MLLKKEECIDYQDYKFSLKEIIFILCQGIFIISIISFLFYRSILAVVLLSPYLYFYFKSKKEVYKNKRLKELNLQFKEGILSISTALNSGYSLENAFLSARNDMKILYTNGSMIENEFAIISKKIEMNLSIEEALKDFVDRAKLEDISNFYEIVLVAKKSGGNLVRITHKTIENITEKLEIKSEIETMIAQKKLEQNIMKIMPFMIIGYISAFNGSYMDILYTDIRGRIIMTVCLIVMFVANKWADKIMEINI